MQTMAETVMLLFCVFPPDDVPGHRVIRADGGVHDGEGDGAG